jgi:hypothetical protein
MKIKKAGMNNQYPQEARPINSTSKTMKIIDKIPTIVKAMAVPKVEKSPL